MMNFFKNLFDNLYIDYHFFMDTRIAPKFKKKYYGIIWDWNEKKNRVAYWIKDKEGEYIPWAHFGKHCIMCCSPEWGEKRYIIEMPKGV